MGRPAIDMTGQKFGFLTVVKRTEDKIKRSAYWDCFCEACGNTISVERGNLLKGHYKSCGCSKPVRIKHGHTNSKGYKSPSYITWDSMKSRCYRATHENYEHYGARGIEVCAQWKSNFSQFLKDMGERPLGTTIDRIDVNGNYEPANYR